MKSWSRVLIVAVVLCLTLVLSGRGEEPVTARVDGIASTEQIIGQVEASPTPQPTIEASGAEDMSGWDYGTCYVDCGDFAFHPVDFLTYNECCSQFHSCPNGAGQRLGSYWDPYYGGQPTLCLG